MRFAVRQGMAMNVLRVARWIWSHPLNRNAPVRALSRFLRWQVASRLIAQPIALPFVENTRLLVRRGDTGATGNWYCGLSEPEEMAFVLHALQPGDLFADIGANVGSYTVLAAGVRGAQVISVEPLPATFSRLEANVRLNNIGGLVDAQQCGLSSTTGEIRFTNKLDTMNRVALPGEVIASEVVAVTTLDALCDARRPFMMKIDVEGHELAVLDGASAVLKSPQLQAVILETNGSGEQYGNTDEQIIGRMREMGFAPCRYDWTKRSLEPVARGSSNTIFVRDAAALIARCRASPMINLINAVI